MNAGRAGTTPSGRDAYHRIVENTLNWQKGSHSINIGGILHAVSAVEQEPADRARTALRRRHRAIRPRRCSYNAANFPGASTTNIANARQLYAILTGRVSEVRGIARLERSDGQVRVSRARACSARVSGRFGFWFAGSLAHAARTSRSTTARATT